STTPQNVPIRLRLRKMPAMATRRPNFGNACPAMNEKKSSERNGNLRRAKANAAGRQMIEEMTVTDTASSTLVVIDSHTSGRDSVWYQKRSPNSCGMTLG